MEATSSDILDVDSTDWSNYPPDRVEGLKYFFCKTPADEAGPPTEEELKMMCLKWQCNVDMRVNNFLFWFMRKAFRDRFKSNKERFQRYIPKIFDVLERRGMESYTQYQTEYGQTNSDFLRKGFEWRQRELQRIRYLNKLKDLCSKWSWSDDDESDDESDDGSDKDSQMFSSVSSISSINTVINTGTLPNRFANYLETESADLHSFVISQESISVMEVEVNTQTFIPETTSTQN